MTDAAATSGMPDAASPRRRWLWIALIVSLAVNALLIGMVMRTLWHVRAHVALGGGSLDRALPGFVASLPAERRDALRGAGAPDNAWSLRPLRLELRGARVEAARVFTADPFDKAAFVAAQSRMFEAEKRLHEAQQRLLPEIGERMTAAERRAYLSWRGRFGGGGRRGGGHHAPIDGAPPVKQ